MARKGMKLVYSGRRFSDMNPIVHAEVAQAVGKTADAVAGKAKAEILTGSKTGVIYKRRDENGNIVLHQASAEGEAPANDVGTLANSIEADTSHVEQDLTAPIDIGAEYAGTFEDLEDGSAIESPRPFLGPAMDAEAQNFNRRVGRALDRAIAAVSGGVG